VRIVGEAIGDDLVYGGRVVVPHCVAVDNGGGRVEGGLTVVVFLCVGAAKDILVVVDTSRNDIGWKLLT